MNPITTSLLKVAGLRLWMLTARMFVALVLFRAHYYYPHWSLITALVINIPLVGIAFYRCIETIRLYANIRQNIDKVQADIKNAEVKAKNKEYLTKLRK